MQSLSAFLDITKLLVSVEKMLMLGSVSLDLYFL